jgi:hypothetical protein
LANRRNGNGNVKGNDPPPARVTLRYTRCASTQGERGVNGSSEALQRQPQRSLRGTATPTATVATRNVNVNGNCRCAGNVKGNGNCRCAGNVKGNRNGRCAGNVNGNRHSRCAAPATAM